MLRSSLAMFALTLAACEKDDPGDTDLPTDTPTDTPESTALTGDTAPVFFDLTGFSMSFIQLALDATGEVVPFSFIDGDGATVEADPVFQITWNSGDSGLCASFFDVEATALTGGPYSFEATVQNGTAVPLTSWNVWHFGLQNEDFSSCDGIFSPDDITAAIDGFLGTEIYVGIAPLGGTLGDFALEAEPNGPGLQATEAGLFGVWTNDGDAAVTNPDEGGFISDQRIFSASDWAGEVIDPATTPLVPKDVGLVMPGSPITNGLLLDSGGWTFTFQ